MSVYQHASPAHVVLHAWLNDPSLRMRIIKTIRDEKAKDCEAFSEVEHKHAESVTSLDYVHIHKSIIMLQCGLQKVPINKLPRSKTLKTKPV